MTFEIGHDIFDKFDYIEIEPALVEILPQRKITRTHYNPLQVNLSYTQSHYNSIPHTNQYHLSERKTATALCITEANQSDFYSNLNFINSTSHCKFKLHFS